MLARKTTLDRRQGRALQYRKPHEGFSTTRTPEILEPQIRKHPNSHDGAQKEKENRPKWSTPVQRVRNQLEPNDPQNEDSYRDKPQSFRNLQQANGTTEHRPGLVVRGITHRRQCRCLMFALIGRVGGLKGSGATPESGPIERAVGLSLPYRGTRRRWDQWTTPALGSFIRQMPA